MKKFIIFIAVDVLTLVIACFVVYNLDAIIRKAYVFYDDRGDQHREIVFFGDSRVAYNTWKWEEACGNHSFKNSGCPGFTALQLVPLVQKKVIDHNPKICVLEVGINDIRTGISAVKTDSAYVQILHALVRQHVTPIVMSVVYVKNKKHQEHQNRQVDDLNNFLVGYCKQMNITYLDMNKYLSKDRVLLLKYTLEGLHFNDTGYKVFYAQLSPVLAKIHY